MDRCLPIPIKRVQIIMSKHEIKINNKTRTNPTIFLLNFILLGTHVGCRYRCVGNY